jgi:hypothetical protein
MVKTTKAQRQAIKRVYDRGSQMSYRDFRKTIKPTFGCDGAVALPWASMWLCIERDGYTHS